LELLHALCHPLRVVEGRRFRGLRGAESSISDGLEGFAHANELCGGARRGVAVGVQSLGPRVEGGLGRRDGRPARDAEHAVRVVVVQKRARALMESAHVFECFSRRVRERPMRGRKRQNS
jgi:hypothetical protein